MKSWISIHIKVLNFLDLYLIDEKIFVMIKWVKIFFWIFFLQDGHEGLGYINGNMNPQNFMGELQVWADDFLI